MEILKKFLSLFIPAKGSSKPILGIDVGDKKTKNTTHTKNASDNVVKNNTGNVNISGNDINDGNSK